VPGRAFCGWKKKRSTSRLNSRLNAMTALWSPGNHVSWFDTPPLGRAWTFLFFAQTTADVFQYVSGGVKRRLGVSGEFSIFLPTRRRYRRIPDRTRPPWVCGAVEARLGPPGSLHIQRVEFQGFVSKFDSAGGFRGVPSLSQVICTVQSGS